MIKSRDGAPLRDLGRRCARSTCSAWTRSPEGLADYRRFPGQLHLLLGRERRGGALGVGAGPVPRGAVRGGPAARPRADRGRLREGLPPGRRACSTRTTTRRRRSSGATSTSSARCARCSATSSRAGREHDAAGRPRARAARDKRWLQRAGACSGRDARPAARRSRARHHADPHGGRDLGTRADRLPAPLRRRLSLEGRDSFTPSRCRRARCWRARRDGEPSHAATDWPWEFVRARATRARPLALEPHAGRRRRAR